MKSAVLELTYQCNLNCAFCYCAWHDHPEAFGEEISLDKWKVIVGQCVCAGVSSFTLTGGDPVLYDGCANLVEYLLSYQGVNDCEFYTNLRVLPTWLLNAKEHTRFRITTSLQGIYKRDTLVGCSWPLEDWKSNCKKVIDTGCRLGVAITITKQNIDDLEQMICLASELGAMKVWVNTMVIEGRGVQHPELWLNADEIINVYERSRNMRHSVLSEITLPGEYCCSCRPGGIIPDGLDVSHCGECLAVRNMIVFGPDGRRRKCVHLW